MASEGQSSSSAPAWANASASNRPAPIEDHTGGMSSGGGSGMDELLAPVSTLDEPVMETIMRDVRAVGAKLKAVMIPLDRNVSGFISLWYVLRIIMTVVEQNNIV